MEACVGQGAGKKRCPRVGAGGVSEGWCAWDAMVGIMAETTHQRDASGGASDKRS